VTKLPYIYRAVVVQNIDLYKSGRIQVRFLQGQDVGEEGLMWCSACVPLGGGDVRTGGGGFFMPPAVGQVVWVAFENGDPTSPVWVGCSYSTDDQDGANTMPIEAMDTTQEPLNRIIKTPLRGHKIELDERDIDTAGTPVSGIRLSTEEGRVLELGDGTGQVRLTTPEGHRIEMISDGIRILTAGGRGIFFSDNPLNPGTITADASEDDLGVMMTEGTAVLSAKMRVGLKSENVFVDAASSFGVRTSGPTDIDAGASVDIGAGDDMALGAGENVLITAGNNVTITTAQTGNFIVDMPIPGTPLVSGNVHFSTMLGAMTFRVGPTIPSSASPMGFTPSTPDFGDPSPLTLSRISLGGVTGGAVAIEGLWGGIYISPIPVILPGLNQQGTTETTGAPRAFITPLAPPTPVQPAVLGASLHAWLKPLVLAFQTYFKFIGTSGALKWGANGGGTLTLAPDVIAAIQAMGVAMDVAQSLLATPGLPGFLSSIVYID